MAVGIDGAPFLIFWNPYTLNSPVYSPSYPDDAKHNATVTGLKYTRDQNFISISKDKCVKSWNYVNESNIWDIKMPNEQVVVDFLNNGRLVIGSIDGNLRECDISSGNCQLPANIHGGTISAFEILDNGDLVSGAIGGWFKVWTPSNYQSIKFQKNGNPVKSLKRLKNGNLACGLANGNISIYNITGKSFVFAFKAHSLAINALELLDNGDLASGSSDNSIKIWNGTSFNLTGEFTGHNSSINSLKLLSNNLLASGSNDKTIKVWNITSMSQVNEVNVGHAVKVLELLRNYTFFNSTSTLTSTTYSNSATDSASSLTTDSNSIINASSTNNSTSIAKSGIEFNFSQLSISEQTELLNSKYDLSGCLVNCTYHGYCKFDSANDNFICACNEFYTDKACKTDSRVCSSSPCLNNATCVDNNTKSFKCECQMGYEGFYCENKINICTNETCSNNGICEDLNNLPKCKCFSMFEGETCSIESSQLTTIKLVISLSSIIAIIVIICFYLIILIMDLLKYCLMVKAKRRKKQIKIRYVYKN